MKLNSLYVVLLILGAALPLAFFLPFLQAQGLDVSAFFGQLFANHISGFFAMDVLMAGLVTIAFTLSESRRLQMRQGPWCLLGLLIGVSVALPLFLWVRQRHLNSRSACSG